MTGLVLRRSTVLADARDDRASRAAIVRTGEGVPLSGTASIGQKLAEAALTIVVAGVVIVAGVYTLAYVARVT